MGRTEGINVVDIDRIKPGDRITWKSQARGFLKEKTGTVLAVVKKGHSIRSVVQDPEVLEAVRKFRGKDVTTTFRSPEYTSLIIVHLPTIGNQKGMRIGLPKPSQITNIDRANSCIEA